MRVIRSRYAPIRGMIYKPFAYDFLLFLLGYPMALWASSRLSPLWVDAGTPLSVALHVYVFFVILIGFRLAFSTARWMYPYVELAESRGPGRAIRGFVSAVAFALRVGFAADLVRLAVAPAG